MISQLVPVRVDLTTAGRDFWKRYHEYRRVRQMETRPDDPLRPDDLEELRLKRGDPFEIQYHSEISRDRVMLSWFVGKVIKPGTPEYESNKHLFWCSAYVRPDRRREGIGAAWLPVLLELMERHGSTVASIETEEDSGRAYLTWLGADLKSTGAENRLKLADVDWAMAQRWVEEGARRSPETKLETHDGQIPEAMWADYAPQLSSMLNTMPWDDLDHGDIVVTPDHLKEWYEAWKVGGERHHTILAREPDGVISAITDILWEPFRPTIIRQFFTGVRPEARGRGLGKWVKAAMLVHLRELYPDAQWVTTGNASSNAPMLAINKKLGFKQYKVASEYQIGRDAVAARVRNLKPA